MYSGHGIFWSSHIIPTTNILRKAEKQDLYGQILIYYLYYLNCRSVLVHSKCDNLESRRTFTMKDFLINAIIICTITLFAMVPISLVLWALGLVQL